MLFAFPLAKGRELLEKKNATNEPRLYMPLPRSERRMLSKMRRHAFWLLTSFEQLKAKGLAKGYKCVLFSQFQATHLTFSLMWQAEFHLSYVSGMYEGSLLTENTLAYVHRRVCGNCENDSVQ